jgi:transposase
MVSPNGKTGKAIAYSLNAWEALCRFLDDGRLCMSNNAAERAMRPLATGRRNWTFAGSDEGGRRAAAIHTLIETAKLNDVDPLAWLADILARLQDHPVKRLDELLPWNAPLPERLSAASTPQTAAFTGRIPPKHRG